MGTETFAAADVLAAARLERAAANAADVRVLVHAVAWARLHQVPDDDPEAEAATWGDSPVPIAGEGVPLVSRFAVVEFAAALGMSVEAGRILIAHALELAHRLPRTWARVQTGGVAPWRARRIADHTLTLSPQGAGFVDAQIAPFAHRVGAGQLDRLTEEAIARFEPDRAVGERAKAADGRRVVIDHRQVSFTGTCQVYGELDLPDAQDLDTALTRGAAQLKALGSDEDLDVRRAKAAGELARRQLALTFEPERSAEPQPEAVTPEAPGRQAVLYLHLSTDAVTGHGDRDARVGWLENHGPRLVTAGTVREWLAAPGTRVSVRPVLDLARAESVGGYAIPDRIREQAVVRDPRCVFPWCTRSSRHLDLDHITPYDPDGPPGQTSTENLAPLCRTHHRAKTFAGWTYTLLEPGTYVWTSPHGYGYLVDPTGTTDLTPTGVDPPPRRTD